MKITKSIVKEIGDKLHVNWDVVSVNTLKIGIEIELEHGYVNMKTNVTDNNLIKTAKIALAHLSEYPDYYERLEKMEKSAHIYWKNKKISSPFL